TESLALFVALTVILELEWVLRAFYGFGSGEFVRVIEHLLGLPNMTVEEPRRILDALARHSQGLDFADALHWAACGSQGPGQVYSWSARLLFSGLPAQGARPSPNASRSARRSVGSCKHPWHGRRRWPRHGRPGVWQLLPMRVRVGEAVRGESSLHRPRSAFAASS
ncbi:MAG: type II toxin-antitoxin system VapC family toxin, partial [Methylococcales bacterium]